MSDAGEYRFRRGFLGKAILQRRVSYPSFIGGYVDSYTRDVRWVDVEYDRLSPLTVTPWQSPDGMDGDGPATHWKGQT